MIYDPQSAFIFSRTDWPSLGAVHSPPPDVPRFGMPLTVWESSALGSARRAAENSSLGSASEPFVQPHPQHAERGIILLCTAWCHRDGGWTIGLIEPTGQDSPWVLKADLEAQLRCECHCDWRPDCPGVVSAPSPLPRGPSPHPMPSPAPPALSAREARREAKRERVKARWFGSAPKAAPAAAMAVTLPEIISQPAFDRWRDQPAEAYRGSIYAAEAPFHAYGYLSGATDQADHATDAPFYAPEALPYAPDWASPPPEPEAVPLARAESRGFWGGLFTRREPPAPAVEAREDYPALGYAPPPDAFFQPSDAQPQIAGAGAGDYGEAQPAGFDYAEALPAPSDAPQLPAPSDGHLLSSQAEIDDFIAAANSYAAPAPEPAHAYEPDPVSYDQPLALPAPEEAR